MSTVLILGATSDIGRALARTYAEAGFTPILAAREPDRLAADLDDLRVRYGVAARIAAFDMVDFGGFAGFVAGLDPLPDIVICVVGLLGDQARAEHDPGLAAALLNTNYVGPALLLDALAARMEARGSGTLIGISSVAGDRGRASNYLYGSAKAGFTAYLSGLRNRMAGKGVAVLTVKPGFVATRMTAGMKLPPRLTAQPAEVAAAILKAQRNGVEVLYVKPVWRLIMLIITAIPERIFKRLKL
jgi:decaprenylphospho-beta-D-erythro-pentofuranosid-2-ulose 2-reductase